MSQSTTVYQSPLQKRPSLTAVDRANDFGFHKIECGRGKGYYHCSLRAGDALPVSYRLSRVFLDQIGRAECTGGVGGVPSVSLSEGWADRGDDLIILNAETIRKTHEKIDGSGHRDTFFQHLETAPPDPLDIYGSGEFAITRKELVGLLETTKATLSPVLPEKFFKALVGTFIGNHQKVDFQRFFNVFRSAGLLDVAERWEETYAYVLAEVEMELERYQGRIHEAESKGCEGEWAGVKYRNDVLMCIRGDEAGFLKGSEETARKVQTAFAKWVENVLDNPGSYGFTTSEDARRTLSMSLTELSTEVCISQKGYFFTSGARPHHNIISPKPAHPITFLSAPGIDFCCRQPAKREARKYFTDETDSGKWVAFQPGGREAFLERVTGLYRVIFEAAKGQGVKSMSMLPLGLGVFLHSLADGLRSEIISLYYKAQFSLLKEDWGFANYYINAQCHAATAKSTLEEMPPSPPMHCNIIFHTKDAKFLAVELSHAGPTAFLNPSDSQAVLQGMLGLYWEHGRSWNYVGEEDWAATGTGVLASFGVCGRYLGLVDEGPQ
eukprot:TRINITY_DN15151_c2_g1_i1.p1 TRINITY_DN15151_c2_g1~~TRINITY_DN15151_c2_g1_i1.p1  ORF type:complete len:552 (+),score=75.89 TRINITY_DN15151_c2_g1_i1:57-1712(+)